MKFQFAEISALIFILDNFIEIVSIIEIYHLDHFWSTKNFSIIEILTFRMVKIWFLTRYWKVANFQEIDINFYIVGYTANTASTMAPKCIEQQFNTLMTKSSCKMAKKLGFQRGRIMYLTFLIGVILKRFLNIWQFWIK